MTRPPGPWPLASTRVIALLGWPARHSLSPAIHNAALAEQGLDLVYVALPTPPERLAETVRTLGSIEAAGANVTVPHKRAVMPLCDLLTPEAEQVGAVNTLAWTPDGLLGDNTDAAGFGRVLDDDIGLGPEARVVLLGTGGAARAGVVALARRGVDLVVVGRRPDAAEEVADLGAASGARAARAIDLADDDGVREVVRGADVIVNATTLGMRHERLPEAFHEVQPHQVAADMVYGPDETPFLADARAKGAQTFHGVGMLVAQAAASYERWTARPAPLATMSAAALTAIEHGSSPRTGPRA